MAATTPTGSRVIKASELPGVGAISPYTLSIASPYQRMQFAASETSTTWLYLIGLPMSRVSSKASSSLFCIIRSANLSSTRLRCAGAWPAQRPLSKVRRATATAWSTSAASQRAVCDR
jgi:hypothetical protein